MIEIEEGYPTVIEVDKAAHLENLVAVGAQVVTQQLEPTVINQNAQTIQSQQGKAPIWPQQLKDKSTQYALPIQAKSNNHTTSNINTLPKISSNFDKHTHTKAINHQPTPNQILNNVINDTQSKEANTKPNQPPTILAPPPHTVKHSYVTKLRARHKAELEPIEFTPSKFTTKQGQPVVIFNRHDNMVKLAARCRFTVVGKFSNTMPEWRSLEETLWHKLSLKNGSR